MTKQFILATIVALLNVVVCQYQYTSPNELPRDIHRFKLDGVVTSVHEGDTFMFYHAPGNMAAPNKPTYRDTMIVRLVGIQAPRMARPGKPGEPLAEESRRELERLILNKRVRLDLFSRDYKNPDVLWGSIFTGNDYVSLKMIDQGLASVLKDRFAEYGDIRRALFMAENVAQRKRVGLWNV